MVKTEYITIKNPSRKLEEAIRKIGVQKYLWLKGFVLMKRAYAWHFTLVMAE